MTAGEATLVGLNPASGVVLLHQVPAGLGQAVLQIALSEALKCGKVTLWNGIPLIAPLTPALQTQVGTSTPDSWILPPVL